MLVEGMGPRCRARCIHGCVPALRFHAHANRLKSVLLFSDPDVQISMSLPRRRLYTWISVYKNNNGISTVLIRNDIRRLMILLA